MSVPSDKRSTSGQKPPQSDRQNRASAKTSSGSHDGLGSGLNDTKSGAEQSVPFPGLYAEGGGGDAPSAVWVADAIARATTGSAPRPSPSQPAAAPPPSPIPASPPPVAPAASKRRSLPRLQCKKCNIVYSGALPKDQKCMECKGPLVDADPVAPPLSPRASDPRHDTFTPAQQQSGSPLLWAPGSSKRSELLVTRYMIKDPTTDILGSGAKGVVYRAHDRRMGDRPVAIKLFFDDGFDDPEAKKEQSRTEREIRIQAALTHPAIVTAHDRFESPHGSGIVLEYIDGESLEERVKKKGPMPVRDAARVTIEVAKAVEYMHSKGIIHRDLKPANVLLTREGNVKLIDFGVAKYKDDVKAELDTRDPKQVMVAQPKGKTGALTREGTIVGTPSYMSPEQALGRVSFVDERSDIYGIGAILYYALTSKPPFIGDDVEAILDRVRKLPPPPPSTWNAKVDKALEALVQKALHKIPEQRFESASQVVEQLRRYVEGERIDPSIYLEPRSQRAARWVAENRGVVVGLVGLLVALAVAFGAWEWASHVSAQNTNHERLQSAGEKLNSVNSADISAAIALFSEVLKEDRDDEDTKRARDGLATAYKAQVHVNLYNEGKALLEEALAKQQAGEDAEALFDRAHYKLRDAFALKSPAKDLPKLIETARGVAKLEVAKPASATGDAKLEIVQLSPDDLSSQQLAVDPPPPLPIAGLSLPTGLYQATITGAGLAPISFPVRIARGTDVTVEPIPQAPPGMVYVRGHPHFRPGHPRHDDLLPAAVEPFYIDLHEVTVGEYREFLATIKDPGLKKRRTPPHWTDAATPEPNDVPVTNVTIDDALAYAAFRGKDIPTEAQWQLAASGGLDDRDYPYGRKFVPAYERCDQSARPDAVGKHLHDRSPFGVLDMSGNVSELVRGFFDGEGTKRLAKGGSFAKKAPLWERIPVSGADRSIGFRCCKPIR